MQTLRRYTTLAATVHLLHTKQITLLNPSAWDDKNDSFFLLEYKKRRNAKSVLALCLSAGAERYHHWRVYSYGPDGVRIQFDKEHFLFAFEGNSNILQGPVKYELLRNIDNIKINMMEDLLFLKRLPFTDEREYRVVYVDDEAEIPHKELPLDVNSIRQITLSPWMPENLAKSTIETLRNIPGCEYLKIRRSTLTQNERWMNLVQKT